MELIGQSRENRSGSADNPTPTRELGVYERKTKQMVLSQYGTIDDFMLAMSPSRQLKVVDDRQSFMVGDFPTLNNIATAYGRTAPIQWLIAQIVNLSEFCGVKDKLTGDQCEELAWLIAGEYSYYTVTQFLTFFHDFKMGRFGKFFGAVDPLVITTAIREFGKERVRLIAAQERRAEDERLAEEAKYALKPDEVAKFLGDFRKKQEESITTETLEQAKAIIDNLYEAPERVLKTYRRLFKKNYGMSPEQYIEKYEPHE